jgi:hypothetical protein
MLMQVFEADCEEGSWKPKCDLMISSELLEQIEEEDGLERECVCNHLIFANYKKAY